MNTPVFMVNMLEYLDFLVFILMIELLPEYSYS